MTHPDAHRFDSDHDFQDHVHGADKAMPYFDSDPVLANELAWDKLPNEMLALCLLFARHDYRSLVLRDFHRECEFGEYHLPNAFTAGVIDTVPIIELLSMENDSAVPQPLRAVCHWVHDKLLAVWEEYHNGN